MNDILKRIAIAFTALAFGVAAAYGAPIVNHGDVNGLRTFQDDATGLVWADLDNYFGLTYNAMKADVESKGFTVSSVTVLHQLLDSLPLTGGEWPSYAAIMGDAPNRSLIWGAYLPESTSVSWAFSFAGGISWTFDSTGGGFGFDQVPNAGGPLADMNIWAYQINPIPEPATLLLLGSGLAGLTAWRYRRRK